MSNKIYPLGYTLVPGQMAVIHYLGFPQAWKSKLLEIAKKNNPRFQAEYGLPTNALKKLIESWMEGVIALAPLKQDSQDDRWLASCTPYSEEKIQMLCQIIRVWVKSVYVTSERTTPAIKDLANAFCDRIDPKELAALQTTDHVCLTREDGTVDEMGYGAIPFLVINRLLGKEIILQGERLHLCYAAKNQLVSRPITEVKSGHTYSFVFDWSVQTTPPERKAMLLCDMKIRRWVPGNYNPGKVPFLSDKIRAHIKISEDKYCQVPILYDFDSKQVTWQAQDRDCYNIWAYDPLPPAAEVLKDPAAYADKVLLPVKIGMTGFMDSKIETGVSVVDKALLDSSLAALLQGMIGSQPEAEQIRRNGQKFRCFSSPQKYENHEAFRQWVSQCAETNDITFELYGLWKEPTQQELLKKIQDKITQDFGTETESSCLSIRCLPKEVGSLADGMKNVERNAVIQRCDEIVEALGRADGVTACLFVLPGRKEYQEAKLGDPKSVLRNAFARTGRVVQFINPEEKSGQDSQEKINHAVYDLYRQLGVVTLLDVQEKLPPLAKTPCVGMHLCTQVHGIKGNKDRARFLPLYVTVDLLNGKTRVQCDAFSRRSVSYREACLEMAELFWKNDLKERCAKASRSPAKQRLIELKNHYYQKEEGVLLVIQADGNTRAVWGGISDKEIGGYSMTEKYCPRQINVGMPKTPYLLSLIDSGMRVMRIRSNQEVPDYFTQQSRKATEEKMQYASASGIFSYEGVYWGIHSRPNDPQYKSSFKKSKINYPKQRFAEKDMIELYPLQLQPGDDPANWIFYTNALRDLPIQYSQSTVLPLPLHLAKALEEYLFEI